MFNIIRRQSALCVCFTTYLRAAGAMAGVATIAAAIAVEVSAIVASSAQDSRECTTAGAATVA